MKIYEIRSENTFPIHKKNKINAFNLLTKNRSLIHYKIKLMKTNASCFHFCKRCICVKSGFVEYFQILRIYEHLYVSCYTVIFFVLF